jgi:ectoine hydroxylase-related dioxygenase (phytanoyl-CoA dioxygenase family)
MTATLELKNGRAKLISDEEKAFYRENGFVRIKNIISREEAARFRVRALELQDESGSLEQSGIFTQLVNVWARDAVMREMTLHPNVGGCAQVLAGVDLRLWHDHLLIKRPQNQKATEFHQDQPYWPHAQSPNPLSCWIALGDVPVERGCMTFLPGSHTRSDLQAQNLGDRRSLFGIAPDLEWSERVTVPLQAGDCTFHHGRCAHMATPNETDEDRVAHVVIFFEANATYNGASHIVTNPLKMEVGAPFEHELFPRVS